MGGGGVCYGKQGLGHMITFCFDTFILKCAWEKQNWLICTSRHTTLYYARVPSSVKYLLVSQCGTYM